jgi:hypothetical protein
MSAPRFPQAVQTKRGSRSEKPHFVRPLIGADRERVTALVIAAIDQDAANAGFAHLAEGDLLCMPDDAK